MLIQKVVPNFLHLLLPVPDQFLPPVFILHAYLVQLLHLQLDLSVALPPILLPLDKLALMQLVQTLFNH